MHRDLNEAGITDPLLRDSYDRCRRLNARHGKTYYLATLLLPRRKRPFVHALYGFARSIDDSVDDTNSQQTAGARGRLLDRVQDHLLLSYQRGSSNHPIAAAVVDTAKRWAIPLADFDAFFDSMRADLTVGRYETYGQLRSYMFGSAGVIGRQMLPILEPSSPNATGFAEQLGEAFQLSNFIRDVGEDLDRGRIYLPLDELARFGVTPDTLDSRQVTDDLRNALTFQIDRVQRLSALAAPGIQLLHPSSQDCIQTARILYCEIADAVAAADFQVFTVRATVPMRRRLEVALPAWRNARIARRKYGPGVTQLERAGS
jgi:phytoene synthase